MGRDYLHQSKFNIRKMSVIELLHLDETTWYFQDAHHNDTVL